MRDDQSAELSAELLNDFYAECETHVDSVRQALLDLEEASGDSVRPLVDKLFRSYHSLKGIIAIAGIPSAERVAHLTEDYLRELSSLRLKLTPEGIDLLARATQAIEETVAAFRQRGPLPPHTELLRDIASIIPKAPTEKESPSTPNADPIPAQKPSSPSSHWKFVFRPSADLNAKGVNVTAIRERLSQVGKIVSAIPRVGSGTMEFEFVVATESDPVAENWSELGLTAERVSSTESEAPSAQTQPAGPSQAATNVAPAPTQMVRVGLDRLDDLMRVAGDLVIQRARLEEQIKALAKKAPQLDLRGLQEVNTGFNRSFRELRDNVMRLRMVPISEIFDRLPFVVRDLTRDSNKKVRLEAFGQQTELDKFIVEQLKDPLLHLVRNAISHGIEDASVREQAGKPAEARLSVSAKTAGEAVLIEVEDDGRGVDRVAVASRARKLGVHCGDTPSDSELLELLCLPGFSTRDEADRAAGRGIGMAVVADTLRELGGSLAMESEPGTGTRFTLRLPLTLLITEALIVSTADQKFAIPQSSVEEVLHIEEVNVRRMEQSELVSVRGVALPLVRLRRLFGFPPEARAMPSVLISNSDRGRVGLVVDRILGQRQVVVRSLRDPLIHVPGVIGATELGDGRPLLILDPVSLTKTTTEQRLVAEPSMENM
jgi:two-component system chemotaxis sensor kinase CheA